MMQNRTTMQDETVKSSTRVRMMRRVALGAAAAGVLTAGAALSTANAQRAAQPADDDAEAPVRVAVYEPQVVFNEYHGTEGFVQRSREIEQAMMQAQQEGDHERMAQLQQEAQELQAQVVDRFYEDIEAAAEGVAADADVHLIAVEVLYAGDDVGEPKNVTEDLIEKVNADVAGGAGGDGGAGGAGGAGG